MAGMRILLTLFLLLIQANRGGLVTENLSGRVVGEDGNPVSGVSVSVQGNQSVTTDESGRFTIALTKFSVLGEWSTVRFSHDGYHPVTKLLTTPDPVIVLTKADDSAWTIPSCTGTPSMRGFLMGFFLPKGDNLRSGRDIDYSIQTVPFQKYGMRLGFGLTWSAGFPFPSQLLNMRTMSERDLIFQKNIRGVEYRGIRTDGSYYRFIGKVGETIEYDRVPKEAASYFDNILDTLCQVPPSLPPK
jgi:hypothetical protein